MAREGRGASTIKPCNALSWEDTTIMMLAGSTFAPAAPETGVTPVEAIPRNYNFAADILARNIGRAGKAAFIDPQEVMTYGALAARVERFGHMLRALGIERE